MADEVLVPVNNEPQTSYGQLAQVSVPLEDAAMAFSRRDESGRIPIIIVPEQLNRIRNEFVTAGVLAIVAGMGLGIIFNNGTLIFLAIVAGLVLLGLGIYRSLYVRIPEGANGLLTRGGRYVRTIGSGTYVLPPWIFVSHLISRREIPFNVPVVEAPTRDNVRAMVDVLVTFQITDPYRFVYNISAADFDEVFQAAAQDSLRSLIRGKISEEVVDLRRGDMTPLRESLSSDVEAYGVSVTNISITYAMPPADIMRSLEARQLAIIHQAEQQETQVLALQRRKDEASLAYEAVVAEVERERERLRMLIQQAEIRRQVLELEAEAETFRLSMMEERLQQNPVAAQYELEKARLAVASALAGNTRAVLQVGSADDIVRSFVLRDLIQDMPQASAQKTTGGGPSAAGQQEEAPPAELA